MRSTAWAVVAPDPGRWRAVPLRRSAAVPTVVSWLLGVLTVAVALTADGAWQQADTDAWPGRLEPTEALGLAALTLAVVFAIGGWILRRQAVLAAPLVLALAAGARWLDGSADGGTWAAGAAVALGWALVQAAPSVRQLRALRDLVRSPGTAPPTLHGDTVEVDTEARAAVRRALRRPALRGLALTAAAAAVAGLTVLVLRQEVGRTAAELDGAILSDVLAAAGAVLGILALGQWLSSAWLAACRAALGDAVWLVPPSPGPLLSPGEALPGRGGTVPLEETRRPDCACRDEAQRAEPDSDEAWWEDWGVPAAPDCPAHGIDRVNDLAPARFREDARTRWLWDERSPLPPAGPEAAGRIPVLGFYGHAHPGFAGVLGAGRARLGPLGPLALEERLAGDPGEPGPGDEGPRPPRSGVLDRVDLRPAGIPGEAVRYRHGRAWFQADRP